MSKCIKYCINCAKDNCGMEYMRTVVQAHGAIIETRTKCEKNLCYMLDAACRWFIVKKAKIFWSYIKHLWILAVSENVESWLVYINKFF